MRRILEGFLYIFLIAIVVLGFTVWFDYLEVIQAPRFLDSFLQLIGLQEESTEETPNLLGMESPWVIERIRLEKEREELQSRVESLEQQQLEISNRQKELDALQTSLLQEETSLEEQKKLLNQILNNYEDKDAVIQQNTEALLNMPPVDAVEILVEYEDQQLINVLRMADRLAEEARNASFVPLWLSLLPPDRAAQVQRKMTVKPQSE